MSVVKCILVFLYTTETVLLPDTKNSVQEIGSRQEKIRTKSAKCWEGENGQRDGCIIIKKWEGKKSNTWKGNGKVILEKNGNRL